MAASTATTTRNASDDIVIDLRDHRLPDGRTMHLVDVENLMGGPQSGIMTVADALDDYEAAAGYRHGDHMVIAAHPSIAFLAGLARPGRVVRAAHGKDGADLALLGCIAAQNLARRFDRVVIGSGDGIFASPVRMLRAEGVRVQVVSRPGSLAFDLRVATGGEVMCLSDISRATVAADVA